MIQFNNVSVSFKQKKEVLHAVKNVTLHIEKGEIFGIVGSSGAGKSTLLRTINLLERPTSGDILIDGKSIIDLKGNGLRQLRYNIGMIFQHFNLAESKTVFDNIAFPLKAAGHSKEEIRKRVDELLDIVGLSDKRDVYPSKLSGGQKQRVGIARALANNAKILICDEPTSALDLETTSSILKLLKDINRKLGITIIIITHELEVVKSICHRAAVMKDGEIIEERNVYDLFTNPREPFTKELLAHSTRFEIPEEILADTKGQILKIEYLTKTALDPVLSKASVKYGIYFNILHGKIEYIDKLPHGIIYVNLYGDDTAKLNEAISYIKENTERVEVIKQ